MCWSSVPIVRLMLEQLMVQQWCQGHGRGGESLPSRLSAGNSVSDPSQVGGQDQEEPDRKNYERGIAPDVDRSLPYLTTTTSTPAFPETWDQFLSTVTTGTDSAMPSARHARSPRDRPLDRVASRRAPAE